MAAPKPKPAPQPAQAPKSDPTKFERTPTGQPDFLRSLVLTAGLGFVLIVFFNVQFYKTWLREKDPAKNGRVARYWEEMKKQKSSDPIDERMSARYGVNYEVGKYLKQVLKPGDTLLIPPQAYLLENLFSEQNPTVHSWVHPCYIYYHAGRIPTLWHNDSSTYADLARATHTFYLDSRGNLGIVQLSDSTIKRQIITEFLTYPYMLCYQPNDVIAQYRAGKLNLKRVNAQPQPPGVAVPPAR